MGMVTSSPLLSSPTPKSKVTSHTRYPHAVYDNGVVFIEEEGWFEFSSTKNVEREGVFGSSLLCSRFVALMVAVMDY
jgi:hypothetical protein